jgi:hypothetical protein
MTSDAHPAQIPSMGHQLGGAPVDAVATRFPSQGADSSVATVTQPRNSGVSSDERCACLPPLHATAERKEPS